MEKEAGPYRLLRPLGKEGAALVFMGVHERLGAVRQVKVLSPGLVEPTQARRLLDQARIASQVHHPAIPEVLDCDRLPAGGAFIASEHVQGEPASAWLHRMRSLALHTKLAAALVGMVADGLAQLHRQGVVHGDLRPENLLLVPDPGDPRRFGVKILRIDSGASARISGPLPPTLAYAAPERLQGGSPLDRRADIYALGCVFFELLSGRSPFQHPDDRETVRAHLAEDLPALRLPRSALNLELERILRRMLAGRPERRYQSMGEVVTALELILSCHRSRFAELLVAPVGCLVRAEPLPAVPSEAVTFELPSVAAPSPARRRRLRAAVLLILAVPAWLLLRGLVGQGHSFRFLRAPAAAPAGGSP
jgi:serine/threonine-protein kinase